MYQLSKEDLIFIVQNFAVHGGVVKLSTPFRRAGLEMQRSTVRRTNFVRRTVDRYISSPATSLAFVLQRLGEKELGQCRMT